MKHIALKAGTVALALLVAVSLMVPSTSAFVERANADEGDPLNEGSTITRQELSRSKTATPLGKDMETEVTISIPKAESAQSNAYDVAFLVDSSSLMRESYGGVLNSMLSMVDGLREQGNKAKVNVCMIGFNNSAKVFFPMTPLEDVTADFMDIQKKRFENVKPFYNHYRNRNAAGPSTYGDLVPWVAFGDAEKDYVLSADIAEQGEGYTLYNFDAAASDAANAAFFEKWPHNLPTHSWAPTGEGTNLQHGMHDAVEKLDEAGATADCKYMVLITDGAAFYYDNEDGESSSTITTGYGNELRNFGNQDLDAALAPGNLGRMALMAVEQDEGKDAYTEADPDLFWEFVKKNGAAIEASAAGVSFSKELMNSKQVLSGSNILFKDPDDPLLDSAYSTAYSSVGKKGNAANPDDYPFMNMERGVYYAAKEMVELRNRGYNFAMVGFKYGSDDLAAKPWRQRALAGAFVKWAAKIGSYFHYPDNAEQHDETDLSEQLKAVADKLFYPIKAGSTLIDEMGFDKTSASPGWWYDLVIPDDAATLADCFQVKADGELLNVSRTTAEGKTVLVFADSTGAEVCKLTYNPDGIQAHTDPYSGETADFTKCYKLDILKNLQTLTMKYREKLVLAPEYQQAHAGEKVTTYANDDAVVEQDGDPTEDFEQPPVEVTIEENETAQAAAGEDPEGTEEVDADEAEEAEDADDADDEDSATESDAVQTGEQRALAYSTLSALALALLAMGCGSLLARRRVRRAE